MPYIRGVLTLEDGITHIQTESGNDVEAEWNPTGYIIGLATTPPQPVTNNVLLPKPTDVAGCILWADIPFMGLANNAPISAVTDQSAGGNNLSQGNPTYQFVNKTNIQNGLAAAYSDSAVALCLTSSLTRTHPWTIIVAARSNGGAGYKMLFSTSSGVCYCSVAENELMSNGANLNHTLGLNAWHVWTFIGDGASSAIYQDGSSNASGDSGTGGLLNEIFGAYAGNAYGWNGYIGTILVYDHHLSDADRLYAEGCLKTEWSTP